MFPALFSLLLLVPQGPVKDTLPGATNFSRVDATVACAGATTAEAYPELKKRGYVAVISLRRDTEPGADIAGAKAAAAATGLRYIHIPIDPAAIASGDVDAFLAAVSDRANQPVYIHCGSANRVGAMWLIKRVVLDGWDIARATEEAVAIGLTHADLKKLAIDYATAHRRTP